jgi:aminopeptidase N
VESAPAALHGFGLLLAPSFWLLVPFLIAKPARILDFRRTSLSYFITMGLLVWFFVGIFLASSLRAEEKFSMATTPGKLPKDIIPRAYVIHLEPNTDDLVTVGSESIDVEVLKPTDRIVINAVDTEISQAKLSGSHTSEELTPQIDSNAETVAFQTKASLQPGSYQLSLTFRSKITEQPHGLFIQYFRIGDQLERLLATQMEPADARRLFPCWDEPAFRAVYQLTVKAKREDTVMSNMPVANEQPLGPDEKLVTFDRTPTMASYLFVLACGKLEWAEDEVAGVKLRILTTPGKKELGRYALEVTKEILPYYNEYFGVPYPLPKLDQIALPSGFGGAMENWGGITYNEDLLLFNPHASSDLAKQRIFQVMAHEIAHQWFGDLVTMAWWDNIWLNEGFASWMEKKATDHFNPDWKIWVHANNDKQRAMAFDARKTSHPIQQPIADEAQANSAFDEITYQKGQSFIRMLENYLGEETFRSGIRTYMAKHKYSNTTTADLWEALEAAAGKPVRNLAASWTEQPGFPLIKVKTRCVNGQQMVNLEQSRFLIGESDSAPLLRWSVPVGIVRVGQPDKIKRVLLDKPSSQFEFSRCDEPIKGNAGDIGFFRVSYEPALLSELKRSVLKLPESDRVNLVTDTWATVESGDSPASTFFELLEGLVQDDSYAVWQSVIGFDRTIGPLKLVNRLEQGQPGKAKYENYVCALLGQKLAELTWDEKVGEPIEKRLLRALLIETLGMFGDRPVIEEASRRFASFRENPTSLNPNLRPAVIRIVGRYSSPTDYDLLLRLAEQSPTSEERRMYLRALSAVLDPELAQRSAEFFTSKHVASGDGGRALEEEAWEHPEIVWTQTTTHFKQMQQRFGFLRWNRLLPSLAAGFIDSERADELLRFAKQNLPVQGQREADNAANLIRFRAGLKSRELPKIDQWIATKGAQVSAYGQSN